MISEQLQSIVNFTAYSYSASWAEMLQERQDQNVLAQVGKVGLYKFLRAPMSVWLHALGGYEVVGSGGQHIVLADGRRDHVVKILTSTILITREEADRLSEYYQKIFEASQKHLNAHAVDTMFYPIDLPYVPKRYAVSSRQPFIKPKESFIDAESVSAYEMTPEYREQFASLTESIGDLHAATGMYPDLLGPNNVMLTNNNQKQQLQIIDTIPETPEKLDQFDPLRSMTRRQAIADILGRWQTALST